MGSAVLARCVPLFALVARTSNLSVCPPRTLLPRKTEQSPLPNAPGQKCRCESIRRNWGTSGPAWTLQAESVNCTSERRTSRDSVMSKYVYFFGGGKAEGRADMKNLLGGKGANLAEMANLGLPVPAGFTIVTDYCNVYLQQARTF